MVTAIVLLTVDRDRIPQVAEELAEMEGISEVFSVSGRYDLVAVIRTPTNEALAELVTGRMLKVRGIERSETLIAFKVYSRHDLETMFALGMEGGG
ncbi:Lrp/AsnC family transcriptional regulator [Inmirania thermothiophila]|uniref:AsnC-like helix-turn-helix protein n=1 Tax=Inmirania thermothiophila TaxID=1750597 RepID=A0A3N1Y6W5_9GAMM|nr:Lrp/AsnC ligand binding domain-containing protein [Inmirania thermothiophila]ROR34569.1 AsnC-like helix-turn-helix protein [Inmirania thermothiophila]